MIRIIFTLLLSVFIYSKSWAEETQTLVTNYTDVLANNIAEIPIKNQRYDLGYVVYSKEFADHYGYPYSNVAELDPGLHVIEFKMKTIGRQDQCFLNLVFDQNIGIDVPPHNVKDPADYDKITFPQKQDEFKDANGFEGYKESPEDRKFRTEVTWKDGEYYRSRGAFDNAMGMIKTKGTKLEGFANTLRLKEYSSTYLFNKDYFSFETPCTLAIRKGSEPDTFRIKKKGVEEWSFWLRNTLDFKLPDIFLKEVRKIVYLQKQSMIPLDKKFRNYFNK